MRKGIVVLLVVVGVLLGLTVVADRGTASYVERQISSQVAAEVPGASSVTTSIHGVPVLTQLARGSLDRVTVSLADVPTSGGLVLDSVDVDLDSVTTSSPRTAGSVRAVADISTAALTARLGDGWTVASEGGALVVSATGALPVQARVTPTVESSTLGFHLDSVSLLGITVPGDRVPSVVTERIAALAGGVGTLPLGLTAESVSVTAGGVRVVATGSHVALDG